MSRPTLLTALPRVFHPSSDDDGPRPVDAILGAIEESFLPIHDRLDHFDIYLDWASAPHGANQDFLAWLGTWVGVSLWPDWPEAKKRFVISQAIWLYQFRGTRVGLEYLLSLFLGLEVRIREWDWPKGMTVGETSTIGLDGPLMTRPEIQRCFVVYWNVSVDVLDHKTVKALHRVIQAGKPAHTVYYVQVQKPGTGMTEQIKKLIIGESSIIGAFFIEGED